jgi:serine/threonine protein kinase
MGQPNRRRKPSQHRHGQSKDGRPGVTASTQCVEINGIEYEVLECLSLPSRGRWKLWERRPEPDGTFYTMLDLANTPAARQLRSSLQSLPDGFAGLPRLVDVLEKRDRLWLVISWCAGIDLETYFDRYKSGKAQLPSVWDSVRRIRSLAHLSGILHSHCRIVHGDIKPANLILPSDRRAGFSIIDYGSSWQIEKTRDRAIGDGADPYYSAPEVFMKEAIVDERADQFSIAVVMYKMLTCELPYAGLGGKASEFMDEFNGRLDLPSEHSKELQRMPQAIRKGIDTLLARALGLEPDHRYPSTRAFCNALDEIDRLLKQSSAIQPSMPRLTAKLPKFVRKWLGNT